MLTHATSCTSIARRGLLLALPLLLLCAATAGARQRCEESQGEFENYVVRRLDVKGPRWGRTPRTPSAAGGVRPRSVSIGEDGDNEDGGPLPLAVGEAFSAGGRSLASFRALRDELKSQGVESVEFFAHRGSFSVLRIDSCLRRVSEVECRTSLAGAASDAAAKGLDVSKCVDVTVRPFYVRVDLVRVGSNYLPVPRSNLPTAFRNVPAPLLALSPTLGAGYDRRGGLSPRFDVTTDLLDLPRTLRGKTPSDVEAGLARKPPPRKTRLELKAKGEKSVGEPFYAAAGRLAFERRETGRTLESVGAVTSLDATHEPLGDGRLYRNVARLGLNLTLKPRAGLLESLTLDAGYRRSNNRLFSDDGQRRELLTEDAFEARALFEGRLLGGFTRLGLWADGGSHGGAAGSYGRAAAVFGFQKEFALALNQTVGFEAVVGAGRASGSTPAYARFYGGSALGSFLYEGPDSDLLRAFPRGPLMRGYGKNQATAHAGGASVGATSFWHVNLSASVPIPALSRPLVPDVSLVEEGEEDEEEEDVAATGAVRRDVCGREIPRRPPTLKNAVKSAGKSAGSFLVSFYRNNEGLSQQEARARACADVRQIVPALDFIADRANLYAVKPLFMFDAARLGSGASPDPRVRLGVGGGVQLTFVVAKFELGYVRAVRRLEGDPRGNVVARLVFQNLF
jgi:hypothetical protein